MNKDKGPLMFIKSVQTDNQKDNGQKVFDSRNSINVKKDIARENRLNTKEVRMLQNIVKMYEKNSPIMCMFNCVDEIVEGVPKAFNDEYITILCDNKEVKIFLSEINSYLIN